MYIVGMISGNKMEGITDEDLAEFALDSSAIYPDIIKNFFH